MNHWDGVNITDKISNKNLLFIVIKIRDEEYKSSIPANF
jgi:hypothetical protein